MPSDDTAGMRIRSLDELADLAVHRGDHLRRRRRQRRAAPVALALVLAFAVLRGVGGGDASSVETRPADRIDDDRAPAEVRPDDTPPTSSAVDTGAAPSTDRGAVAVIPDAASPVELTDRTGTEPPALLYVAGFPGQGQPTLWRFDLERRAHVLTGDTDLCRPSVSPADGTIASCRRGAIVVGDDELVAQATDPDFSPDGDRMAYVDRSSGLDLVWTIGLDGSDRRQLTDGATGDRFPTWSPDGSQLAFVRGSSIGRSVWIVAADGSSEREVSVRFNGLDAHALDWSPDGRTLAFTCMPWVTTAVCLLDVASGEWEPVTPDWLQATEPSWSPDGSRIAFTAHPGSTAATSEVWVMRADGTQERQLWTRATGDDPAWFPVFAPVRPT